jgi:hypothetical protein
MLLTLAISTGAAAGYTAFLSGASKWGAVLVGAGTAASNIYNRLQASPSDRADEAKLPDNQPEKVP